MEQSKKEKLVQLIAAGKNTFGEIHNSIPDIKELELESMVKDIPFNKTCLIQADKQYSFRGNIHFDNSDTFHLTDNGKDLFYQLEKDELVKNQTIAANLWAKRTFVATIVIGIIGILATIIGIALNVLPILPS